MSSTAPLRILVADDHALLRAGVVSVLRQESGLVVVGEAANGEEAVRRYCALRPDIVLLDLQMPVLDGVGAIEQIRAANADARVLVLTTFDADDDIERALRAGAKGYLLKDASAGELVSAIRDVHAGKTRVAPAVAAKLAERVSQLQLTMRELGVLRLLAKGKSNKEIGVALSIAESTVKVHVTNLFEKLKVSSRTEAIAVAAHRGLIRMVRPG